MRKSEVGMRKSELGNGNAECGSRKSEVGSGNAEFGTRNVDAKGIEQGALRIEQDAGCEVRVAG